MAVRWIEGFDHYGNTPAGGRTAMLAGQWAEVDARSSALMPSITSARARTGTYSLLFPGGTTSLGNWAYIARRPLGDLLEELGFGFGIYMPQLPSQTWRFCYMLRSNTGAALVTFAFLTDGSIHVVRGGVSGTNIGVTQQAISAGTWNHIETKVSISAGTVEVRVNGVTVLSLEEVDLGSTAVAQLHWGTPYLSQQTTSGANFPEVYLDDIVVWDTEGEYNNDFIGDHRVMTIFPAGDTAQADWSVEGAASGYAAMNEVPPDGDTSYIQADFEGQVSEFTLPELPPEVSSIVAVCPVPYMRATDAGGGQVQVSLISNGMVAAGEDRPVAENWSYSMDVFEEDPNTGAPWTREGLEDALLRFEKTS